MRKGIFLLTLFSVLSPGLYAKMIALPEPRTSCEESFVETHQKIRKSMEPLWNEINSTVGVEFFMLVLKDNNRMPSSDLTESQYFENLLKGMKRTSTELASHGLKFDSKEIQKIEGLIVELKGFESCGKVAVK